MFRIIGIETLNPKDYLLDSGRIKVASSSEKYLFNGKRYLAIMKVLKSKQNYLLYDEFTIKNGRVKRVKPQLSDDFFNIKDDSLPNISIAAIVGENGQGKSSIIELIMRMVNNVSYILRFGLDEEYRSMLTFVFDIFARMYVEDDEGKFYVIEQIGDVVSWTYQDDKSQHWSSSAYDAQEENKDNKPLLSNKESVCNLCHLFYSIVINYSNYAFWTEEYQFEWLFEHEAKNIGIKTPDDTCWFDGLFNKNDAYQTPIVINPYRKEGVIDFKKEKDLLYERIYTLIFNETEDVSGILNGKNIDGLLLKLKDDLFAKEGTLFFSQKVNKVIKKNEINIGAEETCCQTIDEFGLSIIRSWSTMYGIELLPESVYKTNKWNDDVLQCLANYIVYKTIKIAFNYDAYKDYKDEIRETKITAYIQDLSTNRSHITLKLRRCISAVIFGFYKNYAHSKIDKEGFTSIANYRSWISSCFKKQESVFSKRNNVQQASETHVWESNEFWPAPCFMVDYMFMENYNKSKYNRSIKISNKEYIPYSTLSSGEKHIIHIVASVLYHIQNIASWWLNSNDARAKYHNVCVMLDEAELYAHPKYQKMLLHYLLNSMRSLNLRNKKIWGIQILIATHSPFVLSDIPSCNILSLKEGKSVGNTQKVIGKTFAANVYDILSHKFFMDSFVGEFARMKIEHLLSTIKKLDAKTISEDEIHRLRMEISVIGDDFLRSNIEERLNRAYKKDTSSPSYLELQKEVEELKEQLNNLKQGI